jgi:hypothetical protein
MLFASRSLCAPNATERGLAQFTSVEMQNQPLGVSASLVRSASEMAAGGMSVVGTWGTG